MKSVKYDWGTLYEADVLILGTGASGIGAALKAAEMGADVLMAGKGTLESSGSLGGGNDHFMAVLDTDEPCDDKESFVKFYMKSAFGYRRSQIEQWHASLKPCVRILEECGVEFLRRDDGSYFRSIGFGQPGAWWLHIPNGRRIKRSLAKRVRSMGVQVLDNFQITRLFKKDGKIAGCAGFNVLTGEVAVIRCRTAVNSLGWHAQRCTNNSSHNPYNCWFTPFTTGSYFTLSYDIGVPLINADISCRGTILPKGWGAPGMNGINNMGGYELNALGERFMFKYDPMGENGVRRNQMMGTNQQQVEGYGPPFYMDMRHLDAHDVHHLQYVLMPADKATYLDYCEARGIDFSKYPLEVEVGELSLSGMLLADDAMETPVRGLFAGCNFTSFSGAMCGGYVAGGHAAESAADLAMAGPSEEEILAERERILAPLHNTAQNSMSHREFEDPIRQVMDYYAKFRRNMPGISVAIDRLNFIASYKDRVRADNLHDLMRIHEAFEILDLCRIHLDACLQRKESGRGMYVLTDYPEKDPALNKGLIVTRGTDGPVYSWLEPASC
ncbi:FAD-binding protein [uncultured Mailhella sp.]|uniref:FAD-binding protein n=1 Tax=uncultured Mailhella sp. TaxID=1981031 RepID=UPI00262C82BC|nr:FAD-binding protein [uncultured Mailhella sp.]